MIKRVERLHPSCLRQASFPGGEGHGRRLRRLRLEKKAAPFADKRKAFLCGKPFFSEKTNTNSIIY